MITIVNITRSEACLCPELEVRSDVVAESHAGCLICTSSKRHQQNHSGEVIAELVRPYPIGSISAGPPLLAR
eukprot:10605878-Karenia_brevis.AAC.1